MADEIEIRIKASIDGLDEVTDRAREKVGALGNAVKLSDTAMAALGAQMQLTSAEAGKAAAGISAAAQKQNGSGDKDARAARLTAIREDMKLAGLAYADEVGRINSLARLGQTTENEKTKQLEAALDARHAAELAALQKEMAVGGQSQAAYARLTAEKLSLDAKWANEHNRITRQAAEKQRQEWDQVAGKIASSFTGQLSSILSGTESFGQGMRKAFASLVESIIANLAKVAIELVLIKTLESVLGADFLGGGAGQIVLSAFTGKLPAFDVGAWSIPHDTAATVHAGEMIMPAGAAEQFRSVLSGAGAAAGGTGGNVTHTWNISAVDARSFAQMLNNNSSALSKAINQAMRNGALKPAMA